MTEVINLNDVRNAEVASSPYPHFVVDQSLLGDKVNDVLNDFPTIDQGGSFPLDRNTCGPNFLKLVDELDGPEFRQLIESKLDIDLTDRPMVATLRGLSRPKDGRIHTDSKSKLVTVLIYMNESWDADTGKLRVLYNENDMDNYLSEITPSAGKMFAFKVTDNCWHGYPAYDGRRQSIQINFVLNQSAVTKHYSRHGFSAKIKSLFKKKR